MQSILYSDYLAVAISRLSALLESRPETYAAGLTVSNQVPSGAERAVVLTRSPGGGTTNTVRRSFATVDVYTRDEAEAVDLINLVLALCASRGPGGMADGRPFTAAIVNGGPNDDFAATGYFRQTAELELHHRGSQLAV